jgi:hypothetical protein
MRCYSACRGMYLELRRRPVGREHARPQPPAGSPRYGGGAEEPAPVPVGVTGHRTQRPRGQVGPPGPRPAQPSSSLNPGGERRPIPPPLAPLIAQLVIRPSRPECRGVKICVQFVWVVWTSPPPPRVFGLWRVYAVYPRRCCGLWGGGDLVVFVRRSAKELGVGGLMWRAWGLGFRLGTWSYLNIT